MREGRSVLVPLDGTHQALSALPVARALAALDGASIRVLHVGDRALTPAELSARLQLPPDLARGAVLESTSGSPAEEIVRAGAGSAWIAMCPCTSPVRPAHGIGRTAWHVLRRAACPVILVPPTRGLVEWRPRALLLPLDGTPVTAGSVEPVGRLARAAGAQILALQVMGGEQPIDAGTLSAPAYLDQPQHEWSDWAREFEERLRCLCHLPDEVPVHAFVATGPPGTAIIRFALEHHADLVVLAWRAPVEPHAGRAAKAVIADPPCPILLYRAG